MSSATPLTVEANRISGTHREALAAGDAERAADRLRQALALWRGAALADVESERFAIAAAARLEEERLSALEQRIEAELAVDDAHSGVVTLGR